MSRFIGHAETTPYQPKAHATQDLAKSNLHMDSFDRENQRVKDDQRFEREEDDANIKRQTDAWREMMDNPQMAERIASNYGVEYTPEMGQILQDRDLANRTLEAATMAQKMGINHPETIRVWMQEYVKPGGNALAASEATRGMPLKYHKPGSNLPKTTGLPDGYMWSEGQAVPIPGVRPGQYQTDPLKNPNLPLDLRMEGEALSNSDFPDMTQIQDWNKRAAPYLNPTQPIDPAALSEDLSPVTVPSYEEVNGPRAAGGAGGGAPANVESKGAKKDHSYLWK